MIILPSRGRPHLVKRFIEAYVVTKARCQVILRLDEDDPLLPEYKLMLGHLHAMSDAYVPASWLIIIGPRAKPKAACAWLFERYPHEPWYSLFGDDVIPQTPHWDQRLAEACGTRRVSHGDDLANPGHATHPFVGGDLVRAVGWFAFPPIIHWYLDTAWEWLGRSTDRLVYLPDVVTAHLHPDFGTAPEDQTYRERWLDHTTGKQYNQDHDTDQWRQWHDSGEAAKVVHTILEKCPLI